MTERNRKAVVSEDGESITVLGKDGKEWRLCPASFCDWGARNPQSLEVVGFGNTIWEAIRDAEKMAETARKACLHP